MKPTSRRSLSVTVLLLALVAGLALWYFRTDSQPAAPMVTKPKPAPAVAAPASKPIEAQAEPAAVGQAKPVEAPQFSLPSVSSPVTTASAQPAPATPAATPAAFTAQSSELSQEEVAATARMYAAHAPLRTPEVSDPDSETNRRILQTMVTKAIAQGPSLPPGSDRDQVTSSK